MDRSEPSTPEEPPAPDPPRARRRLRWTRLGFIVCGSLSMLAVAAHVSLLVAIDRGWLPPTSVTRGDELSDRVRRRVAEVALEEGEVPLWFSTAAWFDVGNDGSLLTNRRVVSYWYDEGFDERFVQAARLRDIESVFAEFSGDAAVETCVAVLAAGAEPAWIEIYLSAETDHDHLFVHDLVRLAREAGADLEAVEFFGNVEVRDMERVEGAVLLADAPVEWPR